MYQFISTLKYLGKLLLKGVRGGGGGGEDLPPPILGLFKSIKSTKLFSERIFQVSKIFSHGVIFERFATPIFKGI